MADKTLQTGVDAQGVQVPVLEGPIADAENVTAKDALGVLEAAAADQADAGKRTLTLAGQTVDPEQAYKNLEEALKVVKSVFGGKLKVDLSDLQFQKFHGDMVGESTETATLVDPIMLMHPAMRLAHVIAHELAHDNKKILNEGLVESYVHLWFGEDGAEGVYDAAVENFKEFVLTTHGLKLIFNPYQVGPYVLGGQQVWIPYEKLKDVLPSNSFLLDYK